MIAHQSFPHPWPDKLDAAVRGAWEARADEVKELGLAWSPGWAIDSSVTVLVDCARKDVDPNRLIEAFRALEIDVVTRAARAGLDLDVTLWLRPPTDQNYHPSNQLPGS